MVRYRDEHGAFANREALKKVPRLGAKTFEQAAGFLRIMGGDNPLDASAVHPEAYPVVEQILADLGKPLPELTGDARALKELDAARYTSEQFGLPTVRDILKELEKPGRDPRPQFKTAAFQEGVEELKDLTAGMLLEGVVTNVTNFGAFVDIGVHQDGLVHISMMSHKFIKDPRELVKAGDVLKVKVLEVDLQRRRIALTMKLDAPPAHGGPRRRGRKGVGCRRATIALHSLVMAGVPRRVTIAEDPVTIERAASNGTAAGTRSSVIAMARGADRLRVNHNPTVQWRKPGRRR
jgi:uncharacterized protein